MLFEELGLEYMLEVAQSKRLALLPLPNFEDANAFNASKIIEFLACEAFCEKMEDNITKFKLELNWEVFCDPSCVIVGAVQGRVYECPLGSPFGYVLIGATEEDIDLLQSDSDGYINVQTPWDTDNEKSRASKDCIHPDHATVNFSTSKIRHACPNYAYATSQFLKEINRYKRSDIDESVKLMILYFFRLNACALGSIEAVDISTKDSLAVWECLEGFFMGGYKESLSPEVHDKLRECENRWSKFFKSLWDVSFVYIHDTISADREDLYLPFYLYNVWHSCSFWSNIMNSSDIDSVFSLGSELLGSGQNGQVFKVLQKTGKYIAVKVVENTFDSENLAEFYSISNSSKTLKKEFATVCNIKHPNLIEMYDFLIGPYNDYGSHYSVKTYVKMELCKENLSHFLSRTYNCAGSESQSGEFSWRFPVVYQVLKALHFLHSKNLVHRDLKPDNIFIAADGCTVKLGDFGLSRLVLASSHERPEMTQLMGEFRYLPPEALGMSEYELDGFKQDMYTFGIVLLEIYSHFMNLDEEIASNGIKLRSLEGYWISNDMEAVDSRAREDFETLEKECPQVCLAIRQLLQPDPKKRPSAQSLLYDSDSPLLEVFEERELNRCSIQ